MASLRLNCTICPNSPKFSDLSHLLTHLASKGHLSHEFKAKVRAEQNPAYKTAFDQFEQWKKTHGLNKLLNERILQKEKKRRSNQRIQHQPVPASRPAANHLVDQKPAPSSTGIYGPTAPIDPVLMADQTEDLLVSRRSNREAVKGEFHNMVSRDEYDDEDLDASSRHAPRPYPPVPRTDSPVVLHRDVAHPQGYFPDSSFPPRLDSPSSALPSLVKHQRESDVSVTEDTTDKSSLISVAIPETEIERPSEYTILKGHVWPGMTLFDSASPHAKRIRNQKKDSSTLVAMQAYSETIEPMETIRFYPSWRIKKTREITGQVDSSEDEMPLVETKKRIKKKPQMRFALAQLDKNRSRVTKNRRLDGKADLRSPAETSVSTLTSSQDSDPLPHLNSGMPSIWHNPDDDLDWGLNFDNRYPEQPASRLKVFRDSLPVIDRSHDHMAHDDDADMFVTNTPTPKPQLPPLRTLPGTQTPTPKHGHGVAALQSDFMSTQARRDSAGMFNQDKEGYNFGGLTNANNVYSSGFQDTLPQRYFTVSGQYTHFAGTTPQYMDFAIGHQNGRLMPPPGPFSNGTYGSLGYGNGSFAAAGFENPLSMYQGRSSLNQSPTRTSPSPSTMNPLLDFGPFLGTAINGTDADGDNADDAI